jgi:cellulose synthase/poly-beta-1,6-N-acetylglucosamine synthase-like glycosyltransferase/peptidoglycan/xylan/chitin deacetylase (PgdA/CDA1 family)/spore germination protein YaaH
MVSRKEDSPVFLDPRGRRWAFFRIILSITALAVIIVFSDFLWELQQTPDLPGLLLPKNTPNFRYLPFNSKLKTKSAKMFFNSFQGKYSKRYKKTGKIPLYAFFVNWDDTSSTSLEQHMEKIDVLVPEWLHLGAGGKLEEVTKKERLELLSMLGKKRVHPAVMPLINNFDPVTGHWETAALSGILKNPAKRRGLANDLLRFADNEHLAGLMLDFENFTPETFKYYSAFIKLAGEEFHAKGLRLDVTALLSDPAFNCRKIAPHCDAIVLMAYDEHFSKGDPGPIASESWLISNIRHRIKEIGREKIVLALGNYGYDWDLKKHEAQEVTFQDVMGVASDSGGEIEFDADSLTPTFRYEDEKGHTHEVWFLDAATFFNQARTAELSNVAGVALWRLGSEDPSIWQYWPDLGEKPDKALSSLQAGYDLEYEGHGEVLKVTGVPHTGCRTVSVDPYSGMIIGERITKYPSSFVIQRWGKGKTNQVALTFDDGPSPRYTGKILDVLRKYNAKATFFIIGQEGNLYPGILRREIREGHDIGNHTFTHPNLEKISPRRALLEINATERLLESKLGRKTLIFRPPYGEDVEPSTPAQITSLLEISRKGYYTIGLGADPLDWENPPADEIARRVIHGVESGQGNIVLLHDGGGDRTQTLTALPVILKTLQSRGYSFVGVSEILGLPRESVLPAITRAEQTQAWIVDLAYSSIGGINRLLTVIFIVGLALGISRTVLITLLAVLHMCVSERKRAEPAALIPAAVIIPAYNEEKVVVKTVNAVLASNYASFHVFVVDDGSSDNTLAAVQKTFGNDPRVTVLSQENSGKSEALNNGIRAAADSEVVICMDADTLIHPDAVSMLVRHFADPRVGAVAGNAKVGNCVNRLTRWQALEYITSQNLDRRAFCVIGSTAVVPGAIGAWRRDLIIRLGGFPKGTLAEDADLTLRIQESGQKILYESKAKAYTEAPETVKGFLRQRFRWTFGTLQVLWRHRGIIFRPRYGALGWFLIPYILIFQVFFPLLAPLSDLIPLWVAAITLVDRFYHPLSYSAAALWTIMFYWGFFCIMEILSAAIALKMEGDRSAGLMEVFTQRFAYRQMLYIVAFRAILTAIKGGMVGWDKLERKATVNVTN